MTSRPPLDVAASVRRLMARRAAYLAKAKKPAGAAQAAAPLIKAPPVNWRSTAARILAEAAARGERAATAAPAAAPLPAAAPKTPDQPELHARPYGRAFQAPPADAALDRLNAVFFARLARNRSK